MQNELKITVPEGFEIDKQNSSYELIKFKPIKKFYFREIKTFNDACICLNIDPDSVYSNLDTNDEFSKSNIAHYKLMIIAKAINQGWKPDFSNLNQKKWYPWFNLSSGFGFVGSGCNYGITDAGVGFRHCFETKEKSDYAGKQFIDLYRDFLK
jgi:hypothetical protein